MSLPKHSATHLFLGVSGARAFFNALVFTINLIYQVQTVGLNPLQLVLVGTVLEVTVVLFEVPTGAVADVYSRRLSVIIGMALVGCGFLLEGSIPRFWAVLAAQVLWGVGYTFISGALQAWLADEVGGDAAGPIFLRASQAGLAAGLLGTAASVWLAQSWLQLPIILGGLLYLAMAAYMALTMPETGFRPAAPDERETWKRMAGAARSGLAAARGRPALRILIGLSLVTGLYSEGYDRLWTPHLLDGFSFPSLFGLGSQLLWFGVIGVGATLTGIAANELARRAGAAERRASLVNWLTLLYGLFAGQPAPVGLGARLPARPAGALADQSLPQHDRPLGKRLDRAQRPRPAAGDGHLFVGAGELARAGLWRPLRRLDRDVRAHPRGLDRLRRAADAGAGAAGAGALGEPAAGRNAARARAPLTRRNARDVDLAAELRYTVRDGDERLRRGIVRPETASRRASTT